MIVTARTQLVYDANSHTLFLLGLVDRQLGEPGTPINNATVTGFIVDELGTQVHPTPTGAFTLAALGAGVPVTLTLDEREYTVGDGNYSVSLPETIGWTPDPDGPGFLAHSAKVNADAGAAGVGDWTVDLSVAIRHAAA